MHITDLRKFVRCPKMYKLSLADESRHFPYFNINIDTDDSIIHKLGIENYYTGFVNEDNESTFRAFQQYSWLIRARFSYRNLRVRIPFLYPRPMNRPYVIGPRVCPALSKTEYTPMAFPSP